MACDLTKHGKGAKHPDPVGMLLGNMESCDVFKPLKMSEYDLCPFYQVGLKGDFSEIPLPHEPATKDHIHRLLEAAWEHPQPNVLVAHSQDSVTIICLLCELHANASLRHLKMEMEAESDGKAGRKLSFCPFCQYLGNNDVSYLNHIIIMHYNLSYG